MSASSNTLHFKGCSLFRQRLVTSTLSGKPIRITEIRANTNEPGLKDFEASFLRLLEKITNGSIIEINDTGTKLRYKPGIIVGASGIEHDCGKSRSIGWFLEALICLAPFAKHPITITLKGVTNDDTALSVDSLRTVTLPMLRHFGIEQGLELRIVKRGCRPEGGGEVFFQCPVVKSLKPINLVTEGKVRRVRGVAYGARVSPQMPNRLVDAARGLLNKVLPDTYIYTDHFKGPRAGESSGFGVALVAETVDGCLLGAEAAGEPGQTPEELGLLAAKLLVQEVSHGGCVDSSNQSLALLFMALCPEDVSRIRLGKLTPYTMGFLRLLRDTLGVVFRMRADAATHTLLLSCLGSGFKNLARPIA